MTIKVKKTKRSKIYHYFFIIMFFSLIFLLLSPFFQSKRLYFFSLLGSSSNREEKLIPHDFQLEIESLRHQMANLSLELIQKKEQIRSLTLFREQFSLKRIPFAVPASILIKRDISDNRRTFLIDRGLIDNIKIGSPVTFGCSLLGRVIEVQERTSRVIHITDPAFRVKVLIVGFSKDKMINYGEAICSGQSHSYCTLNYFEKGYEKWKEKEAAVLVAGKEEEPPPWLVMGTVSSPYDAEDQEKLGAGLFWNLKVNILEIEKIQTVLVLLKP